MLSNDLDLVQVFVLTLDMLSLGHDEFSVLHAHIVFHFFVGQVRLAGLDSHLLSRIIFSVYHFFLVALRLVNQVLHISRTFLNQFEDGQS